MSQPFRGQGGYLVFPIHPKNKNLLEDVVILYGHLGFLIGAKNTSLVEDIELLLSVSENSVQRFQRISQKCLSQSEARAAILFFRSARKNTNFIEDVEILLPVKFRWIPLSGFSGEVENWGGGGSCFSDWSEKHKLGRGHCDDHCYTFRLGRGR